MLRLANATAGNTNEVIHLEKCFDIGKTAGGHVLGGLEVFTKAEVVIGDATDLLYEREIDHCKGFPELLTRRRLEDDFT
ncbi:unnamed protein product, partial [Coregonus sp. 'balchen']